MSKAFFPIGTVVELKNTTIPVMIAGYFSVAVKDPNKIWDYAGFIYPTGICESDGTFCFDNEQVKSVISYGYLDEETNLFIRQLMATKDDMQKLSEQN